MGKIVRTTTPAPVPATKTKTTTTQRTDWKKKYTLLNTKCRELESIIDSLSHNKTETEELKRIWKPLFLSNLKRMKNYSFGLPNLKRVNELINKL